MKKLLFVLLLLGTIPAMAQRSAYNDAVFLKAMCDSNAGAFKIIPGNRDVIDYYFGTQGMNDMNTYAAISKNPFVVPYCQPPGGSAGILFPGLNVAGALSDVGNTDVTTIADGLAKFLVQRTKEELSVAFFAQLKQDMANDKYVILRTLFPQTYSTLQTIDQNIYQFSIYLTDLRTSFTADLNNLPTTLPYVTALPQYSAYFNTHPWIQRTIFASFVIAGALTSKNAHITAHAGSLIETIDADKLFPLSNRTKTDTAINGAVKTLKIFSASFRAADADTLAPADKSYWVNGNDILKMIRDSTTLNLYLGLVYQEAIKNNVLYGNGYSLKRILDTVAAHRTYDDIRNGITGFTMQLNLFDANWKTIRNAQISKTDSAFLYYDALFNSAVSTVSSGLSLAKNLTADAHINVDGQFWSGTDHFITALHDVSNTYLYINQKKYAMAIVSLTDFFSSIAADDKKLKNIARTVQKLNTYGTFMAQVANAKTSDEVDSIITSTVLPVGSSYIKKHSRFNIALNGYTGLYIGQQRQATDSKFVGAAGVYAPIGLAVSWGLGHKNPSSISLFASIIDLGPLVSFRFTNYNDTLANNVKIRLNQILSPGLHLVYGVPKLPLSVGGGLNWTPLITSVEKDKISTMPDNKPALRYELFIAVDIPLLNFYNKPK